MSENVAMLEAQVERITREKNSLVNQLEESQHQLASHEMEMNKVGTLLYLVGVTWKMRVFFVSPFFSVLVKSAWLQT